MTPIRKGSKIRGDIDGRTGSGADEVMYSGADKLSDDFFANIDESSTELQAENQTLKERLGELEKKLEESGADKAIVPRDDGSMVFKRFEITPTGLKIPEDATGEELAEIGLMLRNIETAIQWNIGDWAKYLTHNFNVSYEDLAAQFGYTVETLYAYASVCDGVATLIRNQGVSFSHHRLVTKMKPREQRKWLDLAVENDWKVSEMRAAMRQELSDGRPAPSLSITRFRTKMTKKREELREIAQNAQEIGGETADEFVQVLEDEIAFLEALRRQIGR